MERVKKRCISKMKNASKTTVTSALGQYTDALMLLLEPLLLPCPSATKPNKQKQTQKQTNHSMDEWLFSCTGDFSTSCLACACLPCSYFRYIDTSVQTYIPILFYIHFRHY